MDKEHFCNECKLSFKSARGLLYHNQRAYGHNDTTLEKSLPPVESKLNGGNNKRIIIPYEKSDDNRNKIQKFEPSKPQYVDIDKLQFIIENEYDNYYDGYSGADNDDDDDDDDVNNDVNNKNERKGWLETIDNIISHPNSHPHHPDLNPGPILSCMKYQLDLYSQIYGLKAIESKDIQEYKNTLKSFDKRNMNMMRCYFFAREGIISVGMVATKILN